MMACNKSMVETTVDCPLAPNQSVLVRKGCEAYVFALTQKSVDSEAEWTDIFSKKKVSKCHLCAQLLRRFGREFVAAGSSGG